MANDIDEITPPNIESPDTAMAPTPGYDVAPSGEYVVIAPLPGYFLPLEGNGWMLAINTGFHWDI